MNEQYPFELAPLPYAYDALEPYIDTRTVTVHHDRHQAGYVKKLNEALREFPEFHSWSLEQLILGCDPASRADPHRRAAQRGRRLVATSFISTA